MNDIDLSDTEAILHEMQQMSVDHRGRDIAPALKEREKHLHDQQQKDHAATASNRSDRDGSASEIIRRIHAGRIKRNSTRHLGTTPLSKELIMDNLSMVGKNPFTGKHSFLELVINDRGLNNIEAIRDFPNLIYLDISRNSVLSLSALEALRGLTHLDASRNELHACLDFAPKRCNEKNSWPDGGQAVGSMLSYANVSKNNISDLEAVQQHPFLECLIVHTNGITLIEPILSLKHLQVLDISHNRLASLVPLKGLIIQELSISGNNITDLSGVEFLSNLASLDASENKIESLLPLQECKQLTFLNVSKNEVQKMSDFFVLKSCPCLRKLLALNNPASDVQSYRTQLVYQLPSLTVLDFTTISSAEKVSLK